MFINYSTPLHIFNDGKNRKELLMEEYRHTQKRLLFYEGLIEHRLFMLAVSILIGMVAFVAQKVGFSQLLSIDNNVYQWLILGLIVLAITYGFFVFVGNRLVQRVLQRQDEIIAMLRKIDE